MLLIIPGHLDFSVCQNRQNNFFENEADSEKILSLSSPVFYTNSDFLVGAEITDPAHPSGFFTRVPFSALLSSSRCAST